MCGWNRHRPFSSQVCTTAEDDDAPLSSSLLLFFLLLLLRVNILGGDESTEWRRLMDLVENLDVE